ncbi:hypothetical protein MCOR25_005840 [Pyricularia grisea]|nr:hypothetical protein MCOR25_005840 [Pyricularia grisea]
MIIRNIAVRHGRSAFAAPVARAVNGSTISGIRSISTETFSTSGTVHASTPPTHPLPSTGTATATATSAAPLAVPRVLDPRLQARFGQTQKEEAPDTTARDWIELKRFKKKTSGIGSQRSTRTYRPSDLLRDPPKPKDVTLELLMASQCHMGHHKSLWNPSNSRFIYGVRQDIHIISLEQTAAHLRRAARLVEEVAFCGGLILFAGTRQGHMEIVTRAAELSRGCHLFNKWTPGTITNRDQLLAGGALRMVDEHDRELPGFEKHLQERRPITPDLVVVLNPLENNILLHECKVSQIPTIGVIDTNADVTKVTYPIPANDDSLRSMAVIAGVLGRAGELGQKRRLADAKGGQVHWENPADVARFLDALNRDAIEATRQQMEVEVKEEQRLLENATMKDLLI